MVLAISGILSEPKKYGINMIKLISPPIPNIILYFYDYKDITFCMVDFNYFDKNTPKEQLLLGVLYFKKVINQILIYFLWPSIISHINISCF
jgi:hypothetical protein